MTARGGVWALFIGSFSLQFNWHSQPVSNSPLSQLISSRSVPVKNCREGRSRFLKKDSAARVRKEIQSTAIKLSSILDRKSVRGREEGAIGHYRKYLR